MNYNYLSVYLFFWIIVCYFLRFLLLSLSMCLFAGKDIEQKSLLFKSLNALPGKQVLTQSSGRIPKRRCGIC